MTKSYLVWIAGLRGPEAQIWHDFVDTTGKIRPHLDRHELHEFEAKLGIDELKLRYPYEVKE